jgi:hypothetical protein
MNQQEIKANLPPLPLHTGYGLTIYCFTGMHVLDCYSKDYSNNVDKAIQHSITHAVNNTYGKGINPESVPDMFNALTLIEKDLRALNMVEIADKVQDILKNAKL